MFLLVKGFILPYNTPMRTEEKIINWLKRSRKTLSLAESCTGGLLADRLTDISGCSNVFKAGFVTYSNDAKAKFLKVPKKLLTQHGAVSQPVAMAMAKGARLILKTDFAIAITGIAGPAGGSKEKPVGLTFIAVSTPKESVCIECQFKGERKNIKSQAANQALQLFLEFLET